MTGEVSAVACQTPMVGAGGGEGGFEAATLMALSQNKPIILVLEGLFIQKPGDSFSHDPQWSRFSFILH